MTEPIQNLRNIGIIAHIDAGKTTVTEHMLLSSGAIHRVGQVDKGTTETDFDPEEQQRGITIYSACVNFRWKDASINLIDTPGHVDFTAEVERCLRVLDGGVVVFSAREGVEAQSETVWRQANKYHVPRIAFINKMDREGADFEGTVQQIRTRLEGNPVAVQIPVGAGPPHLPGAFRAIVDVIEMTMLTFSHDGATVHTQPIPDAIEEEAAAARERMLDQLSNYSDQLMEHLLEEKPVPPELVRKVIRDATLQHLIQPVLCGAALDGIGIQPLLDAVAFYLPSPLDVPPVEGTDPRKKKDNLEKRKPNVNEPFCGLVFKVIPAKTGDLSWVRVYSGQLKANSRAYNPGKDKKENVPQLWRIQAARREQVSQVLAGDIAGIIGLRHSITGDTLCDYQHPILLEPIQFPETVISMAIEPETTAERKKLAETLEMMKRQDPTFAAVVNEETGQTLISGMGELHLEVIKNRLLRDFNLNVKVHKPRVSYRETVEHEVEVVGSCHRHVGGQALFAELRIRIEHDPGIARVTITATSGTNELPPQLLAAALDELRGRAEGGGVLAGFPLMQLKVTALGGTYNEASNEVAFRIAAADAFEKALRQAGPVLLEPVMRLVISTPQEHLGDFVGDLQQRRAIIQHTENRGKFVQIEARAPLAELFGYSSAMRSLSQGRAGCSMEPLHYAPAPPNVTETFLR